MPHSSIAWKQIGVGYLVCACIFLGALAGLALPPRALQSGGNSLLGFLVLLALWALACVVRRLARRIAPAGLPAAWREPAKTAAVLLLFAGSMAATAALALRLWQVNHG
ncbi:hypothetical protein BKE38_28565 [Pseudoroseomonas deserti]|uniref:Transmembrane protein n=1 Tax=Teichococcus deserti TaxID=1817963 RepID=A0A1V2GUD7_9PROT|nr:hypothetical protein [Pseudoroseomonas deserti]ONG43951.1 hypothetical protein BKE38_28565 [Pseudoroseomonas deserti]